MTIFAAIMPAPQGPAPTSVPRRVGCGMSRRDEAGNMLTDAELTEQLGPERKSAFITRRL